MLVAPPVDGTQDEEEEGGSGRAKLLLLSTEIEEPPPFHVDSRVEELCSRRLLLMLKLSWLRPVREATEEGSDRRPGETGGGVFNDIGGRSEP